MARRMFHSDIVESDAFLDLPFSAQALYLHLGMAADDDGFVNENVLIYADPPYLLNTRGGKQYRHEMDERDHIELLEALLQHKGSVILSGYPSELYSGMLSGWREIHRKSYNQNADPRTEVLWCNFDLPDLFAGGYLF